MSHHHQHHFPRAVPIREAVTFAGFAIALIGGAAAVLGDYALLGIAAAQAAKSGSVFNRATYSSPIAMSADPPRRSSAKCWSYFLVRVSALP